MNSVFTSSEPTWANACVGDNGSPSYVEYAHGFARAANLLIGSFLDGKGREVYADDIVYPICFNMRHAVELHLKGAVEVLVQLAKYRGKNLEFDLKGSHDIGNIWVYFKDNSVEVDERYDSVIKALDTFITDLATVDPTGQTFRYAVDIENQKHLTEVKVISIQHLANQFAEAEHHLTSLFRLGEHLEEEYRVGDSTTVLTRFQLFSIARRLPQRRDWGSKAFTGISTSIKEDFSLPSKKAFSNALDKIQENIEMSYLIGVDSTPTALNKEALEKFFDAWFHKHSDYKERCLGGPRILSGDGLFQLAMKDDGAKNEEALDKLLLLNDEQLSAVVSVYQFRIDHSMTEYFWIHQERERKELEVASRCKDERRKFARHFLDKADAFYQILHSLVKLKRQDLSDWLLEKYEMQGVFDNYQDWISDMDWNSSEHGFVHEEYSV
ncbi:hypothetical protein LB049_003381 [Vibrio vulnificus]|nr:hypothetical protein [Vibrio vulnificus]